LGTADIYVAIVGFRYGSTLPDGQSYTEMEFRMATSLKLPRLIFLLDETRADPLVLPAEAIDPRQTRFRELLLRESGLTLPRAASPENLELRLYQALVELRHRARLPFTYSPDQPAV